MYLLTAIHAYKHYRKGGVRRDKLQRRSYLLSVQRDGNSTVQCLKATAKDSSEFFFLKGYR